MDIVVALLALILGLAVGLGAGIAIGTGRGRREGEASAGARASAGAAADEERMRLLASAVLADAQQRLVEINVAQQQAITAEATAAASRQEKTVNDLVEPIDRKLRDLTETLTKIERSRVADASSLQTTITQLGTMTRSLNDQTRVLATAMKDNKARGTWGEMQLRRVVELAGMIEHCDFVTQTTVDGDDGRLRPDLVVQLPQSRAIVVDSKVPMSAYLDAVNAEDPAARKAFLEQHARDVAGHVNELQRRDYGRFVAGALDYVVMFVPGDTFLEAAFETNASWFEDSIAKGVFPASPGSLIALLRAISYGWRQEQLAENAEEIANLGRELHQRIATMAERFAGIGKSLGSATKAYNDAVASMESRVLVTTRKLEEKGIRSSKDIPALEPVEAVSRPLTAPELQVGEESDGTGDQDRLAR